jgi:C1A family cysteine protease
MAKSNAPVKHEIKWYGYKRDMRDPRDHEYKSIGASLPSIVDLRPHCPPVMNQGQLGSCVAHGTTGAVRYLLRKSGKRDHNYSRLQLYYDGRVVEGTVKEDSGLEIRDAIKCVAKLGVGHETLWPYKVGKFANKPPQSVYTDALKYQSLAYQRVTVSTSSVMQVLADGYPVIIGVTLFESFESDNTAATGLVPMPALSKEQILGGHCMYVVGYGQKPDHFTVRNSWDTDWGDKGDCYFPYGYIGSTKFGGDYWAITKVEM